MDLDWDVLIVGRSYAALSAALTVARARQAALVVGEGGPRNEAVAHVHGVLTRDGSSPGEMIAAAEADVGRYPSVELVTGRVLGIEPIPGGFRARLGARSATAAAVILATGVNDNPPSIPGLAAHWGRGVFTCPFCDGWEHADLPLAVVGDVTEHGVRMVSNWTDQLTVYARPSWMTRSGPTWPVAR